jgi:hypothetical protein
MYQTIIYFKCNQTEIHRELLVKKYVQWNVSQGIQWIVSQYAQLQVIISIIKQAYNCRNESQCVNLIKQLQTEVKHKGVHSTVFNIISNNTIQCYTKGENCLVK